jgi:ParB-like chromosome segregation protein Spo0J
MQMALRTLSVGELRSPNSTPRHHSKKQRTKARALFAEQGIVVPIIVDDRMRIIDGVLRFETAKELGLDELNAVVVSNSTDAQLLQLELSLNRLAEDSAWNAEHLKTKFEQLIEYQVDLTFTDVRQADFVLLV